VNVGNVSVGVVNLDMLNGRRADMANRLSTERNEIEKKKLDLLIDQLNVQIEQAKLARQQNEHSSNSFIYQQKRDESLLRRMKYKFRQDKLVVVVSDFSSGGTGEGVEVADEIGNALAEIKDKGVMDFEVLVGETLHPIRSVEAAQDIGAHFPVGTCYAVVWGTLSPKTVGMFRPHVTCVYKSTNERGVSSTFTMNLEAQGLPFGKYEEIVRRERHRQLIAFTCATIPGCYASYELSQERIPKLGALDKYLDGNSEGVTLFKEEIAKLSRWPQMLDANKVDYLTRLSRVMSSQPCTP